MPSRRLSPPERAVWGQVARTVTPIEGKAVPVVEVAHETTVTVPARGLSRPAVALPAEALPAVALPKAGTVRKRQSPEPRDRLGAPSNTLDAGWDRRLAKGLIAPDRTIDLHGETLQSAHATLEFALGDALRSGARLILLITGKAGRDNPRLPPTSRGVIRASIADWLANSPYASRIAAVRNAHPRHGGAGALYVILKRARGL
jgi:DNA-nicking Smr family endonuclease